MIYEVKENYNKHLYFHSVQLIFFLHTFNIYYICTIYTSEPAWLQYNYEHCTQHRTCTIFLFSGLSQGNYVHETASQVPALFTA